jgi:hypothetical protein
MNIETANQKITFCNASPRSQVQDKPKMFINEQLIASVREYEQQFGSRSNEDIKKGLKRTEQFVKTIIA